MPHRLRSEVAKIAHYRCEYCLTPEGPQIDEFEVEHVEPESLGGADELWNLALSCGSCNRFKGQATHAIDPNTSITAALFHPRRHQWDEHFTFDSETLEIHGLTPTGRATVRRLRMNRQKAIEARNYWVTAYATAALLQLTFDQPL